MKSKSKKKSKDLLLAILGCDQKMLDLILHLFERFEVEFGKSMFHNAVRNLGETEGRYHLSFEPNFPSFCKSFTIPLAPF